MIEVRVPTNFPTQAKRRLGWATGLDQLRRATLGTTGEGARCHMATTAAHS